MPALDRTLGQSMSLEAARFERKRLYILSIIFSAVAVASIANYIFLPDQLTDFFSSRLSYKLLIVFVLLFMVFLLIRLAIINWAIKKDKVIPSLYKWISSVLEITYPLFVLVMLLVIEHRPGVIDSPAVFFFFLFMTSSVFYLEPKIPIVSGIIAGAGYCYLVFEYHNSSFALPAVAYFTRAMLIVLGGFIAAAVSHEMRQYIRSTISNLQEAHKIESLFGQQVSPEVVSALKDSVEAVQQIEVSVMFLDIRDFTKKVEGMPPVEVNAYQNRFFRPVIDIINKHHGIVNQLLGDGLMATFGAPQMRPDHSHLALAAAREIFDSIGAADDGVKIGMGLHCGSVVTGNIGTDTRKQYSVSGTTVIVAARLEQLNKQFNSQCLASASFHKAVIREIKDFENLGLVEMKGLNKPIEVIKLA